MKPARFALPAKPREEAEKPFWISFSDLMSALMVLFLVSMTVALLAITHEITVTADVEDARTNEIDTLLRDLEKIVDRFPGVTLRGQVIDFGERARFDTDSHRLGTEPAALLRRFTPELLTLAEHPAAARWLKRIVVDGYADARGGYLHNLHLSLLRAERVLCILLASPEQAPDALSEPARRRVRDLFFVGGSSFNVQRASLDASRRIEMRLEFLHTGETRTAPASVPIETESRCPLDPK